MAKILIFLLLVFGLKPLMAQNITQIQPIQNGNAIEISYKINGAKFDQKFDVELFVSFDGGLTFKGPMQSISGDVLIESKGGKKAIVWDAFKDVDKLDGDLVFDVRATVEKLPVDKVYFAQYSVGIMLTSMDYSTPFGLMVGKLGNMGWYGTLRLNSLPLADYSYDGETMNEDILYQFTDKTKYPRISALGGVTYQIKWNAFLYAGLGYGIKSFYQEIEEYSQEDASMLGNKWVSIDEYDEQGIELEVGSIIKFSKLNVSLGLSTLNFKHLSMNVGVGYSF